MTVMIKATGGDSVRGMEAAAIDRLTAPLSSADFDADWQDDVLIGFWRRGTRDAVLASCASRSTWQDALMRVIVADRDGMPLAVQQNIAMFLAAAAWRDGMLEAAGAIIGGTPEWEEHRGLSLIAMVIAHGNEFSHWENALRATSVDNCLAFEG